MTSCPFCAKAKEYLSNSGIEFTDHDVSRDNDKAKEMFEKSRQMGVPVLQINGRIIVGFDRQLIDDALKRKKPMRRDDFFNNVIYDPFAD